MAEFTSGIIDIGIVVRDVERAVAFYRDAIGFEPVSEFEVPAELGGESGLTDRRGFTARVMQLGGTDGGTRIKLIGFGNAPCCCDTNWLHSVTGFRYLTVRVADMDAAISRAAAAGVRPLGAGPVEMPPPFKPGNWLAMLRDPEGNLIELIGPRSR